MIARLNCHLLPGTNFTLCKAGKAERRSSSPEVHGAGEGGVLPYMKDTVFVT